MAEVERRREPEPGRLRGALVEREVARGGLALGGLVPTVAVFSLALTLVLAIGPGLPSAVFPLLALITSGLGYLLESMTGLFDAATLAPAVVAPWLLAFLLGKPFSSTYRSRARIEITSPLK